MMKFTVLALSVTAQTEQTAQIERPGVPESSIPSTIPQIPATPELGAKESSGETSPLPEAIRNQIDASVESVSEETSPLPEAIRNQIDASVESVSEEPSVSTPLPSTTLVDTNSSTGETQITSSPGFLQGGLQAASAGASGLVGQASAGASGLVGQASAGASGLVGQASAGASDLVGKASAGASDLVGKGNEVAQSAIDGTVNFARNGLNKVTSYLGGDNKDSTQFQIAKSLGNYFGNYITDGEEKAKKVSDNITGTINSKIDQTAERVDSQIDQTADSVNSKIDQTAERVDGKIDQTADSVDGKIDQTADSVNSTIDQTAERVDSTIDQTADSVDGKIDQTADSVTNGINSNVIEPVNEQGTSFRDKFVGKLTDAGKSFKDKFDSWKDVDSWKFW